jgi:hypothetical protein
MKRVVAVLLAVSGLVIAGPTSVVAVRDLDDGNFQHLDHVRIFRNVPAMVGVGTWITVGGGWAAASSDLRSQFENSVAVTMTLDGVPQTVFTVERTDVTQDGCTVYFVDYQFLHPPLAPGNHEAVERWTASADVADAPPGGAGTCFGDSMRAGDTRVFSRTIAVSTPAS